MKREKVSVIIPTYNRADCIEKSIRSVLEQTYRDFELIIVDDGSSDNTHDVVNSIDDERIRYVKMPENRGASAARNEGIRQAAYDYIAFQDSDDMWKPDKLEKQMRTLMDNPQAGMVYCEFETRTYDGSIIIVPAKAIPLSDKQGKIYDKMLYQNMISTQTVVARREALVQEGLFCEKLTCLEDWDFFLRIAKDYEIAFLEEALVCVHRTDGSVSFNAAGYFEARCYMIAQHKEELLKRGQFNKVVEDVLIRAQKNGILEQVNKMLQYYLQ